LLWKSYFENSVSGLIPKIWKSHFKIMESMFWKSSRTSNLEVRSFWNFEGVGRQMWVQEEKAWSKTSGSLIHQKKKYILGPSMIIKIGSW